MGTDGKLALAARLLGAISLWVVGAIHLSEYNELYSSIPTIGPLFLLSFVGATATALGLLAPLQRLLGRFGGVAVVALALIGIGQAVTQFAFLKISEHGTVFGFHEPGYEPEAIRNVQIAEWTTVVLLTAFLIARAAHRRSSTFASATATKSRRRDHHMAAR
jgi:hypothetical protein